jgi:hypothetical protein
MASAADFGNKPIGRESAGEIECSAGERGDVEEFPAELAEPTSPNKSCP